VCSPRATITWPRPSHGTWRTPRRASWSGRTTATSRKAPTGNRYPPSAVGSTNGAATYYALALFFGKGSFLARRGGDLQGLPIPYRVGTGIRSLEAWLAGAVRGDYYVGLRTRTAPWLHTPAKVAAAPTTPTTISITATPCQEVDARGSGSGIWRDCVDQDAQLAHDVFVDIGLVQDLDE